LESEEATSSQTSPRFISRRCSLMISPISMVI
jgi:hypothetical protein